MKKIIAIVICMTLVCLSVFSLAGSGKIKALKNKGGMNETNNQSVLIQDYISNVAPILIGIGDDIFLSSLSSKDVLNAKLSEPMPIFASKEDYAQGEDSYGKLQVNAWMFIVYSNDSPIAVITTDQKNRIDRANSIYGQEFAISVDYALNKIDRSGAVVIPTEGYFFVADENDKVTLASTENLDTSRSGIMSFEVFNKSVNKAIDYNASQDELLIGGGILLDTLYGDETEGDRTGFMFGLILLIAFISAVIIYRCYKKRTVISA